MAVLILDFVRKLLRADFLGPMVCVGASVVVMRVL